MRLRVEYWGLIRSELKRPGDELELPPGTTVGEVFARLAERYGDPFRDRVLNLDGSLASNVAVLVDGVSIHARDGMDTPIHDEQAVHVLVTLNAIAGGGGEP